MSAAVQVNRPAKIANGDYYITLLKALHSNLKPRTYLEIGTDTGVSFALAECASLAIDPAFKIDRNVIANKPSAHFYQMPSDSFSAVTIRLSYWAIRSIWHSSTACIFTNFFCAISSIRKGTAAGTPSSPCTIASLATPS